MARREFSIKIKQQAWERCAGKCEKCGKHLTAGDIFYDHVQADGLGGEPSLQNCQVLCKADHHEKTVTQDTPAMIKADNIRKKHLGIKSKRPWPKPRDPWRKQWRERAT